MALGGWVSSPLAVWHCGALVDKPARPIAGLAVSEADDCVRQQPRHSGTILVTLCQTLDPCLPDGQTNYCTDFMGSPLLSRLAGLLTPPVQDACYAQASPPHPRSSAEPAEDRLCPTPVEVAPAELKVSKVQKINNLSIPTQSQIHRGLTTVTRTPRELENSKRRCLIVYPSLSKATLCNF